MYKSTETLELMMARWVAFKMQKIIYLDFLLISS